MDKLAEEFLIGKANAYGTTTFYDFLKPENKGKKVYVCNGSACVCAGSQTEVFNKLSKHFKPTEIGHMTCLGRCYENYAFNYNGNNFSGGAIENLKQIIEQPNRLNDNYNVAGTKKVLTEAYEGLEKHYRLLKDILKTPNEDVLAEIINSNIRGRGGAGFPMGIKWKACKQEKADKKFIICNADEGDPGAYSDRFLLEERPHHVLFGMMVAGYITGASWGVIYVRAEYPESVSVMENAINELRNNKLIGSNVLESGFSFDFKLIKAQGAYICGEETALINSIEGQRPEVRTRPPYPTQQGLFNKPTVVNNVETLAAVYWILKNGASAYDNLGTEKSSGTKLICLDSFFYKPGLYEVEMGTALSTVIYDLGGGFKEPVKALHIGGPLGGIVPVQKISELTVDFESFASNGFLLGHASVVSIPQKIEMVDYLEHLFDFAAYESCGKCFPCRLGTKRGHELFKAAQKGSKINKTLLEDLLVTLKEGSLCAHGGGIPLPINNALTYFEDELSEYLS